MKLQEKVKHGFYCFLAKVCEFTITSLNWLINKLSRAEIALLSAAARLK